MPAPVPPADFPDARDSARPVTPRTTTAASRDAASRDDSPPEETIRLDQFLKLQGLASTGGQAKVMIQAGEVLVNGQVETRRRRQLRIGDIVEAEGETIPVESDADDEPTGDE